MVGGREAWSAWARQCGSPGLTCPGQRVTEHQLWSFPGWTRLLQGGAQLYQTTKVKLSHWAVTGLAGLAIITAGRSKHLSGNINHYRTSQSPVITFKLNFISQFECSPRTT